MSKFRVARRTVQILVVVFMFLMPVVARYQNYVAAREIDRVLDRWSGTVAGGVLSVVDSTVRLLPGAEKERAGRAQRDRARVLEYVQAARGGPWSATVGPVSMTDPLGAAESIVASRAVPWVLLASLVVPLVATVVLGRVFCSWICPMGFLLELTDKLRAVVRFLEIRPRDLKPSRATKYGVLLAGLILAAVLSVPVLGYIYPPAIVGREAHDVVFAFFDRAEMGRFGPWAGGLSWMAALLVGIVLFEVLVSRRWWCRYVCPGGALYSLIGWARPVRVELDVDRCTQCAQCVAACPEGLNPMKNRMGLECDSCGECIASCDDDALRIGLGGPLVESLRSRSTSRPEGSA